MLFSRKPLKELVFQGFLCYNKDMKNEVNITTSSTEMMTISRAEYESLKAERDELNQKLLLVTKWLYPDVARKYGTNWKAVERNIRTVSTIAWKHNLPLLESLSHRHLDRRLRSAEFLAVLFHAVCSDEFERPA